MNPLTIPIRIPTHCLQFLLYKKSPLPSAFLINTYSDDISTYLLNTVQQICIKSFEATVSSLSTHVTGT